MLEFTLEPYSPLSRTGRERRGTSNQVAMSRSLSSPLRSPSKTNGKARRMPSVCLRYRIRVIVGHPTWHCNKRSVQGKSRITPHSARLSSVLTSTELGGVRAVVLCRGRPSCRASVKDLIMEAAMPPAASQRCSSMCPDSTRIANALFCSAALLGCTSTRLPCAIQRVLVHVRTFALS